MQLQALVRWLDQNKMIPQVKLTTIVIGEVKKKYKNDKILLSSTLISQSNQLIKKIWNYLLTHWTTQVKSDRTIPRYTSLYKNMLRILQIERSQRKNIYQEKEVFFYFSRWEADVNDFW